MYSKQAGSKSDTRPRGHWTQEVKWVQDLLGLRQSAMLKFGVVKGAVTVSFKA